MVKDCRAEACLRRPAYAIELLVGCENQKSVIPTKRSAWRNLGTDLTAIFNEMRRFLDALRLLEMTKFLYSLYNELLKN